MDTISAPKAEISVLHLGSQELAEVQVTHLKGQNLSKCTHKSIAYEQTWRDENVFGFDVKDGKTGTHANAEVPHMLSLLLLITALYFHNLCISNCAIHAKHKLRHLNSSFSIRSKRKLLQLLNKFQLSTTRQTVTLSNYKLVKGQGCSKVSKAMLDRALEEETPGQSQHASTWQQAPWIQGLEVDSKHLGEMSIHSHLGRTWNERKMAPLRKTEVHFPNRMRNCQREQSSLMAHLYHCEPCKPPSTHQKVQAR
eukprot:2707931-Amphidinium_carterae.2